VRRPGAGVRRPEAQVRGAGSRGLSGVER
jgi:hypothetical protein